jgi:hypothetical protein
MGVIGNPALNMTYPIFTMPKVSALAQRSGIRVQIRLIEGLFWQRMTIGTQIASGTLSSTLWVTSATNAEIRISAGENQYLGTKSVIEIPLGSLDGVCISGLRTLRVEFFLLPTTVAAMDASSSIASIVGPASVVLANPASAVAVTRLAILQSLISCQVDVEEDDGSSLLGWTIGPSAGGYMRGAAVGNCLIVVAFTVAMCLVVAMYAAAGIMKGGGSFVVLCRRLCCVFHFPGAVMLPVAAVCQPTLTACVKLIVLEPVRGDRVLGICGAVIVVVVLMLPFTLTIVQQFCLKLVKQTHTSDAHATPTGLPASDRVSSIVEDERHATGVSRCTGVARHLRMVLLEPRWRWVAADASNEHSVMWKKKFLPIFVDSGAWWYPLVDMWAAALVGAVGGLAVNQKEVCRGQLGFITLVYLICSVLQLFVVKTLVPVSKAFAAGVQVLGVVSCIAVIALMVEASNDATMSLNVAQNSMLLIAALCTVKSLMDACALALAIPRALRKAFGIVLESTEGTSCSTVCVTEVIDTTTELSDVDLDPSTSAENEENGVEYEQIFNFRLEMAARAEKADNSVMLKETEGAAVVSIMAPLSLSAMLKEHEVIDHGSALTACSEEVRTSTDSPETEFATHTCMSHHDRAEHNVTPSSTAESPLLLPLESFAGVAAAAAGATTSEWGSAMDFTPAPETVIGCDAEHSLLAFLGTSADGLLSVKRDELQFESLTTLNDRSDVDHHIELVPNEDTHISGLLAP